RPSRAAGGIAISALAAAAAFELPRGRLTPGGGGATAALAVLLFGPVTRFADLAATAEQAGASVRRLADLLDRPTEPPAPAVPVVLGRPCGRVEFVRVRFPYRP